MNLILWTMLFDPRFWWLAVGAVTHAPAAETDEGAQA